MTLLTASCREKENLLISSHFGDFCFRLRGALQLLSNRHMQIRFAHVHDQILLLRFVEILTAITSDLPMKPGKTRT